MTNFFAHFSAEQETVQAANQARAASADIAGEHNTGDQLAAGLSHVFGEPVRYQHVPAEIFRDLPFPGAELAANMFQFVADDNGYDRRRDVDLARALDPSLAGFTEWGAATRERFALRD